MLTPVLMFIVVVVIVVDDVAMVIVDIIAHLMSLYLQTAVGRSC